MASRYGIVVDFKIAAGGMDTFISLACDHFHRQHDGREPGATFAAILMPSAAEPDSCSFFEQWETKDDYDAHSAPNENLKFFLDNAGELLAQPPAIREGPMQHWLRQGGTGTKHGIIVRLSIAAGMMGDFLALAQGHFDRQHDGREENANMATILQPAAAEDADTIYFFEQWQTQADYEAHSAPNENLKAFLDACPALLNGPPEVREGSMPHWEREDSREAVAAPPVVLSGAPLAYTIAPTVQYTSAPVVYAAAPPSFTYAAAPMVVAPGQQVVYTNAPTVAEDGQVVYASAPAVAEGAQVTYAAPPPVMQYAAPGRVNVSHDLFAKLAAGGALSPEEIAQLEGTAPAAETAVADIHEAPVPEAVAAAVTEAAVPEADTSASPKKSSKKKEKGSKKALKASKKKEKGCC